MDMFFMLQFVLVRWPPQKSNCVSPAGQEGEPELRRQLRAARLAEKHAKMKAALAEKQANDEDEARRREEQVQLKDQHKDAVNVWKNKNKVWELGTLLWATL